MGYEVYDGLVIYDALVGQPPRAVARFLFPRMVHTGFPALRGCQRIRRSKEHPYSCLVSTDLMTIESHATIREELGCEVIEWHNEVKLRTNKQCWHDLLRFEKEVSKSGMWDCHADFIGVKK